MAGRGVDLTNDKEVQEYLENLGIEYRFGCYHEKSPKSCQLLGEFMEAIKQEFPKAFKIFETNCDVNNFGASCFKAGSYKAIGRATNQSMEDAYDYFVKGCQFGHAKACLNAGLMEELPPGENVVLVPKEKSVPWSGERSQQRATEFFKKACEGDNPDGCFRIGTRLLLGMQDVLKKEAKKAIPYLEKGCELNSRECCANLAILYKKGADGVPVNEKLSRKFVTKYEDIVRAETEQVDRLQFQEGVESAAGVPLQHQ